ncbi:MAG: transaldolase [Myxococcota bacterium]
MRLALGEQAGAFEAALRRWDAEGSTRRLRARDATLFSNADEARWLGWLDLPFASVDDAIGPAALRDAVARHPAGFAVVLGMGGSSLWPDVLGQTWNGRGADEAGSAAVPSGVAAATRRPLFVLDTTVPDAIERFLGSVALERGLYFVSSKSGSTIEPNALYTLIRARLDAHLGREAAGRHFVAITDPGSALEARAKQDGFLGIAPGRPDVGGRFSALSPFGMLPAFSMGLDPERLLAPARRMATACSSDAFADANPGVALGLALGVLARAGRDKLTLSLAPSIESFGAWIEQLVAESTGKSGRGLLPISGEGLFEPGCYGKDWIFVDVAVGGSGGAGTGPSTGGSAGADVFDATRAERAARLDALERAGHPVIRLELAEPFELGAAAYQWEVATAVVGAVLGLNPFDQPDVEAAKQATRALMASPGGAATAGDGPGLEAEGLRFFAARELAGALASAPREPAAWLRALVDSLRPGDGFLVNAFVDDSPEHREALERLRRIVGRARPVATALSIGPRYLHSTGQLQKGGPNRLAGLQLWQSASARRAHTVSPLAIPEIGGDFDALAEAQALGDFRVLSERGRRMLGVDLGHDPQAGLERLIRWMQGALA